MTASPGAVPVGPDRTRFTVWAPAHDSVGLHLLCPADRRVPLVSDGCGRHSAVVDGCGPGTRYRLVLADGRELADPASRSQPEGVHGPSEVVDLAAHQWGDQGFEAPPLRRQVQWEVHVGTATPEGTFDALAGALAPLVELGVTTVELMPVAQFPGTRNWGYDGVFPFAPQHSYGGPAGLQRLVDACHRHGLAVVLDVVYNHFGPEGNVLGDFGPYTTDRYRTPWGEAVNVDGPGSDEVRAYFLANARQWFEDYHVDALRLDAVHGIVDGSASPFLAELAASCRRLGGVLGRPCRLIAESADNDPRVVTALEAGGLGMDAQWNDDFHHSLHAALTGERQAYYADFGPVDDLARAMGQGFVYQGEYSPFRRRRHGAPSGALPPERFVIFAQNHDHVGNRAGGERLSSLLEPAPLRLAAALVLLAPGVPLLFMGEEYGETAPFPYFVDHQDPELLDAVRRGRRAEHGTGDELDPGDPATMVAARLSPPDGPCWSRGPLWRLHRALIALRQERAALTDAARHATTAWSAGPLVTMVRHHRSGPVAVLWNVGPEPVAAVAPAPGRPGRAGGCWQTLLDGADPALGGSGPRVPAEVEPGSSFDLGPWGFVALGAPAAVAA